MDMDSKKNKKITCTKSLICKNFTTTMYLYYLFFFKFLLFFIKKIFNLAIASKNGKIYSMNRGAND